MTVGYVVAWMCPVLSDATVTADMRVFSFVFKNREDAELYRKVQTLLEPGHVHLVYELHPPE